MEGLSLFPGEFVKFPDAPGLKVPHMGWNDVNFTPKDAVSSAFDDRKSQFYFVHSYYAAPRNDDIVWGKSEYGGTSFVSAVRRGNCRATQFHPEKSQALGLALLTNFLRWKP